MAFSFLFLWSTGQRVAYIPVLRFYKEHAHKLECKGLFVRVTFDHVWVEHSNVCIWCLFIETNCISLLIIDELDYAWSRLVYSCKHNYTTHYRYCYCKQWNYQVVPRQYVCECMSGGGGVRVLHVHVSVCLCLDPLYCYSYTHLLKCVHTRTTMLCFIAERAS